MSTTNPKSLLKLACFALLATLLTVACDDDEGNDEPCTVGTSEGCGEGQVCDPAADGTPTCFAPVEIRGRVFDAATDEGIGGATVVALDANGAARSSVSTTNEDGTYALLVFGPRDANGIPVAEGVTLRASAADYQTFPTAPRTALPVGLDTAADDPDDGSDALVVRNTATDVALIALPGDQQGLGSIEGRVEADDAGGVLVVAEQGGTAVSSAVTGSSGSFVLFNVPAGSTQVTGYRAGLDVEEETVDATDGVVRDVVLSAAGRDNSVVEGSVNIVNAPGGSVTSVILVVESTFDENAIRGEAPAGLRATDVQGAFRIEDVPPGDYVVLAAFENDDLVRDPDTSIGGTSIVRITVPDGGGTTTLPESFKVTEALAVVSPGATGLEPINTTSPTFVWADDSSEDGYELRVFDAFGELVHEALDVPRVTGSDNVEYTWSGADLQNGMVYQFRVLSWKDDNGARTYISASEDLEGVFEYAP